MSATYAAYIYTHMLKNNIIAPTDIFSGTQFTYHKLKYVHTWGYPVSTAEEEAS